jgi:hypothetical protein
MIIKDVQENLSDEDNNLFMIKGLCIDHIFENCGKDLSMAMIIELICAELRRLKLDPDSAIREIDNIAEISRNTIMHRKNRLRVVKK